MQLSRRDMLSGCGALGAMAILPGLGIAQTGTEPPAPVAAKDPMSYVNPEFRAPLRQLLASMGAMPDASAASLPGFRKMSGGWGLPVLPSPTFQEKMIQGAAGSPQVRVYVAGDSAGASKPAVLHIHGGGYVSGAVATDKRSLQDLAIAHDCVVVSVDYRLAPEVRYPGSLEDNYAALKWLYTNAESLGVDRTRIAIKGESAGGGHAAALAIAARDRGEIPICLQVLIYPMLDDRTGSSHSLPTQFGHFIWTAGSNRFGWSSLLGVPAGSSSVPKGSVPARLADLSGLAPAFIGVGSIDLFAPEDIDYAQRLILAGVPTELNIVPGAFHGFDVIVPDASLSKGFAHGWNEALRRAFTKA